jgi:protein deglycase
MKILVLLAQGFEEVECVVPVDIWRRAGVQVDCCSIYEHTAVEGARGVVVSADLLLREANLDEYDALYLPGGNPGYINLGLSEQVLATVRIFHEQHKTVVAICAAPVVLFKAGVLEGHRITSYPSAQAELEQSGATYCDDDVVQDAQLITSRGPATSHSMAFAVLEKHGMQAQAQEVAKAMLYTSLDPKSKE